MREGREHHGKVCEAPVLHGMVSLMRPSWHGGRLRSTHGPPGQNITRDPHQAI